MADKDLPCFGDIRVVFPMGDDGLRHTPASCFECAHKTECLRAAMKTDGGLDVKDEMVDRAYQTGIMGFFERWSKKKSLNRQRSKKTTDKP